MLKISKTITMNDAPELWELLFQNNDIAPVDNLEELRNCMLFYLAIVFFAVSWTTLSILLKNYYAETSDKDDYIKFLEWIILILLVFVLLGLILLELSDLMDKLRDPSFTEYLANLLSEMGNNGLLMGTGHIEYLEPSAEIDFSKLFMNNQNAGGFTNRINDLIWHPITMDYTYGVASADFEARLIDLSNRGKAIGLFEISNIDARNRSCTLRYLQPVPALNYTQEIRLLKELVQWFPHGLDSRSHLGYTLDGYRMQGHLSSVIESSNNQPNWPYRANQNKPVGISPYYDPTRPVGYYGSWPKDIAEAISRYKKDNVTKLGSRVTLDSDSAIFLSTFRNAHRKLNPTNTRYDGPIITLLREL